MNDDATNSERWGSTDASSTQTQSATPTEGDRIGFCQDCGKPLTQSTVRTVGTGVFCEPCLTARVAATAPPAYTAVPPVAASDPSPALAALLGFIPGAGAAYNGQYAKGIAHLVIFAALASLASNVNGFFGLCAFGWVIYMVIEAHHTAVARRDGLPLPNGFGFNEIGERMGFGKGWGNARPAGAPVTPPVGTVPVTEPYASAAYPPVNPVPVGTAPDWVGYVPPTAFTAAAPADTMAAQIRAQAMTDSAYPTYSETYAGTAQSTDYAAVTPVPEVTTRKFPTGAFWLIGLGVLILAANLLPDWKLTARWWAPILFAGLSIWLFTRRLHTGARLICIIRWPVVLMVLAIMLALHAAYVPVTFGLTVSILLIVFGALLLAERAAGSDPLYAPPAPTPGYSSVVPPPDPTTPTRVAWEAPVVENPTANPDDTKGGL
jgi:hypothetical protein